MEKETYETVIETLVQQLNFEKWKLKLTNEELEKKNKALEEAQKTIEELRANYETI